MKHEMEGGTVVEVESFFWLLKQPSREAAETLSTVADNA